MSRNRLLTVLRARLPASYVAAFDQQHASRIVIRDPNDTPDGFRWGRWAAQVFRARPVPGVTVWHRPHQMLEMPDAGAEQWLLVVGDGVEVTGWRDEVDLVDYLVQELERAARTARRAA